MCCLSDLCLCHSTSTLLPLLRERNIHLTSVSYWKHHCITPRTTALATFRHIEQASKPYTLLPYTPRDWHVSPSAALSILTLGRCHLL